MQGLAFVTTMIMFGWPDHSIHEQSCMQNENDYARILKDCEGEDPVKLTTFGEQLAAMSTTLEELNHERERKESMFCRQQVEAEVAMTQLLKEEEEEARKTSAVGNAQKSKKKGT